MHITISATENEIRKGTLIEGPENYSTVFVDNMLQIGYSDIWYSDKLAIGTVLW